MWFQLKTLLTSILLLIALCFGASANFDALNRTDVKIIPVGSEQTGNQIKGGLEIVTVAVPGAVIKTLKHLKTEGKLPNSTSNRAGGKGNKNSAALIDDLVAGGIRITPDNVVDIRNINGRIVWLETGNSRAGLQHIVDGHVGDFATRGVTQAQIPDLIFDAMQNGRVVGSTGSGRNVRSVYEVDFGGTTQRVAIGIGDNGFVVTAHPF